jgi:hypothetical protein
MAAVPRHTHSVNDIIGAKSVDGSSGTTGGLPDERAQRIAADNELNQNKVNRVGDDAVTGTLTVGSHVALDQVGTGERAVFADATGKNRDVDEVVWTPPVPTTGIAVPTWGYDFDGDQAELDGGDALALTNIVYGTWQGETPFALYHASGSGTSSSASVDATGTGAVTLTTLINFDNGLGNTGKTGTIDLGRWKIVVSTNVGLEVTNAADEVLWSSPHTESSTYLHLALVSNGEAVAVYENGVAAGNFVDPATAITAVSISIDGNNFGTIGFADLFAWNSELTEAEVARVIAERTARPWDGTPAVPGKLTIDGNLRITEHAGTTVRMQTADAEGDLVPYDRITVTPGDTDILDLGDDVGLRIADHAAATTRMLVAGTDGRHVPALEVTWNGTTLGVTGGVTASGEVRGGTLKADNISPTQVAFATALGQLTGGNDLTWDDTGKVLAVGGGVAATGQITSANTAALKEPTGFESPESIEVSYDATDRTITLTQAGGVDYWYRGARYTLESPWTSDPHDDSDGRHFLQFANPGVGGAAYWTTTVWDFADVGPIAEVIRNAALGTFGLREVHGLMPWQTHRELHEAVGTYRRSGGALTADTFQIQPAAPADADNTPGVDALAMADEDLPTTNPAFVEGSQYRHAYVVAGAMTTALATYPFNVTGTYLDYHNGTAFVEGATGKYYNLYILAIPVTTDTDSQSFRFLWVQPQREHASLAAAQAESLASVDFGNLTTLLPEIVFHARITMRTAASYGTVGKCRIEAVEYLTVTRAGAAGSSVLTAHAATHLGGGTDAIDWTQVHQRSTLALRPAAAAANAGLFHETTDTGARTVTRSDGAAWNELPVAFRDRAAINVRDYLDPLGWVDDGSAQPLSDFFATLGAAQAVFPNAAALTDEVAGVVLQYCINQTQPDTPLRGGTVKIPKGTYRANVQISFAGCSGVMLEGEGATWTSYTNIYYGSLGVKQIPGATRITWTGTGALFAIVEADPLTGIPSNNLLFKNLVLNVENATEDLVTSDGCSGILFSNCYFGGGNRQLVFTAGYPFDYYFDKCFFGKSIGDIRPNYGIYVLSSVAGFGGQSTCLQYCTMRNMQFSHVHIEASFVMKMNSCTLESCYDGPSIRAFAPDQSCTLWLWNVHWENIFINAYWNGTDFQRSSIDTKKAAIIDYGSDGVAVTAFLSLYNCELNITCNNVASGGYGHQIYGVTARGAVRTGIVDCAMSTGLERALVWRYDNALQVNVTRLSNTYNPTNGDQLYGGDDGTRKRPRESAFYEMPIPDGMWNGIPTNYDNYLASWTFIQSASCRVLFDAIAQPTVGQNYKMRGRRDLFISDPSMLGGATLDTIHAGYNKTDLIWIDNWINGSTTANHGYGTMVGAVCGKDAAASNTADSWFPLFTGPGVSPDRGNAGLTWNHREYTENIFNTPLTTTRSFVISDQTYEPNGSRVRVIRAAAATGLFDLIVYSNKNVAELARLRAGQWAECMFDGSAWVLIGFGLLADQNKALWVSVPAGPTASGTVGEIAQDGEYFYVCTATNTWRRTAIGTWAAVIAPANVVAPAVTGAAFFGNTMTTTDGTWSGDTATFTYAWYCNGVLASDLGTAATCTVLEKYASQSLVCKVTATNASGSVTADSNSTTIAWAPSLLSNLLAWYDAADPSTITLVGSKISQWNDKSASALHLTQGTDASRPTYTAGGLNSRNVATYGGAAYMATDAALSHAGAYSAGAVVNNVGGGRAVFQIGAVNDKGSLFSESSLWKSRPQGSTGATIALVNNAVATLTTAVSTTAADIWKDGTLGTPLASGGAAAVNKVLTVGGLNSTTYLFSGYMAEIVLTGNTLGTTERQKLEGYLAYKWGQQGGLPGDHPYKSIFP